MRPPFRSTVLIALGLAGFAVGVFGTALWSAEDLRLRPSHLTHLGEMTRLEPVRALPRTAMILAAMEARAYLDAGRPWQAWSTLREHVAEPDVAGASTTLLAARAAAGWGGWKYARELLRDRPWLEETEQGEGLFLLARAEEELGQFRPAAAAYERYLAVPNARFRGLAGARLGRVLRAAGDSRGAAAAFAEAAPQMPEIEDWLRALQAEQLAAAEDPEVAKVVTTFRGGSAPVRLRRVQAEVGGWIAAGDVDRAIRRLEWEARVLSAQGASLESSQLQLDRARQLIRRGATAEARDLLRSTAMETTVPSEMRHAAATLLGELDGRTAADEIARAAGYEAARKPGLAARSLRAAIAQGAPDDADTRLRLARLLYDERDFGPARPAFQKAAEVLRDRELLAEAELYAARSLFRSSGAAKTKASAIAEFRRIAERYEGTAAAGTALFLLGDEASTTEAALGYYRRAAAVKHSPDAREALYRVGDRSLKLKDPAAAARAWEEYVARYPRGDQTAQVAYEAGKLHERAGRESAARLMYTAAALADPISYYALRAGNRLGIDPLERIVAEPRPWIGLAADAADAGQVVRRLEALEEAGLAKEWEAEFAAAVRAFEQRPAAMVQLAEGVRDRHPVQAIRLGRRLASQRGDWDVRLLRVVFPFPYRELVEAESRRARIDPMLFAGLIRQESTFRPAVRSWVGATGLGQIMPATGRWLAPSVGVAPYEEALLEVPEVNLRMGARYLGDLLRRYDGAADLALAGYNAGPSRASRWKRELNHGRDIDAFREAIPFDETRHYVKVVLRNAAIYERLYGTSRGAGLVTADR